MATAIEEFNAVLDLLKQFKLRKHDLTIEYRDVMGDGLKYYYNYSSSDFKINIWLYNDEKEAIGWSYQDKKGFQFGRGNVEILMNLLLFPDVES